MPVSKFDGKCKTCGQSYAAGQEAYCAKINDKWYWCGSKDCIEQQKNTGTITQPNIPSGTSVPKVAVSAIHSTLLQDVRDDEVAQVESIITRGREQAKFLIPFYVGIREACEANMIREPAVIGMIFKEAVDKLIQEKLLEKASNDDLD